MTALSPELRYATLTALFTAVLWVPIILNRLAERGFWPAIRDARPDGPAHAAWADRLDKAHRNAIENLVVFAPLAIMVHVLGAGTPLTAGAAAVFFFARVAHAVVYAMGVPVLRTLTFAAAFTAEMILALRILGVL